MFFSVVIPTYNRAEKLKKTIQSVLDQTFNDFEILVMDDGSTDNSYKVVESFGDPRIVYKKFSNSGGPATPRNHGIDISKGKWISFLDADDLWHPEKLHSVWKAINNNNPDVVCHNESLVIPSINKHKTLYYGPYERDFYKHLLLQGNRLSTSATSVKKEVLIDCNLRFNTSKEYTIVEDYDLWLNLARVGCKFVFLEKVLGEYIVDSSSISTNISKLQKNRNVVLYNHVYSIQSFEKNKDSLWKKVKTRIRIMNLKEYIINRQYTRAVRLFFKIFLNHPVIAVNYIVRHLHIKFIRRNY